MTTGTSFAQKVWWLFCKDLKCECRAPQTMPAVLLFGFLLMLILNLQTDLPEPFALRMAVAFIWLTVFIAGTIGLDRSFAAEHEEGCWDALRMYPVSPGVVFTAKTLLNWLVYCAAAGTSIMLFAIFSDAVLLIRPAILLIAVLASLAYAAIGTLVAAVTNTLKRRSNWIALLLLPLVLPVVLGAGEATWLVIEGRLDSKFWNWLGLLAAFAAIFLITGAFVFEFVMED
jgi:heme exporter protein B